MTTSLKTQAEDIMTLVRQAQEHVPLKELGAVQELLGSMLKIVNNVDLVAAEKRINALKAQYPQDTPAQLSQRVIREKCQRTGMVGILTSSAGLIPGLGTVTAMTLGAAADIQATFKLQAELVIEIALVYNYPLTETEKQQIILVVTGLGSGSNTLARQAGVAATSKITEKVTQEMAVKALPVIGVIASASTNALSTYIIGQRADAYFRLGPEAMGSWSESLRTISGVDERKLVTWLGESGGQVLSAGKATGAAIATGASQAGQLTQNKLVAGAKAIWRFIWRIITFILIKIGLRSSPPPLGDTHGQNEKL